MTDSQRAMLEFVENVLARKEKQQATVVGYLEYGGLKNVAGLCREQEARIETFEQMRKKIAKACLDQLNDYGEPPLVHGAEILKIIGVNWREAKALVE